MSKKPAFRGGRDPGALTENMELLTGQRGSGLDKALTLRELERLGLATLRRVGSAGQVIAQPKPELVGGSGSGGGTDAQIPAQPLNLAANGAFHNILLTWDKPNYRGHSYTEIWRAPDDNLSNATLVGTTSVSLYADATGTELQAWYWVRFVNTNNQSGPFSGPGGVHGETAPDVDYLLGELAGEISESELTQALTGRLDTHDAKPDTFAQANEPAGKEGDYWYDTVAKVVKRYDGNDWITQTQAWSKVEGEGKPEDGATVGADWAGNLTNKPTSLSAISPDEFNLLAAQDAHSFIPGNLIYNGNMTLVGMDGRPQGVKAAYHGSDPQSISYADAEKTTLKLHNPADSTIGAVWPAFKVVTGAVYRILVRVKASVPVNGSFYFRMQELDVDLEPECTHVSFNAIASEAGVQEATRQVILSGGEYRNLTTSWSVFEATYRPKESAKWASPLLLNYLAGGSHEVHIDRLAVYPEITTNHTFAQDTEPTASMVTGDFWVDTNDGNRIRRYDGTSWVDARDAGAQGHMDIWGLKNDAGDITVGIGLMDGGQGNTEVAVMADRFYVFDPAAPTTKDNLFVVEGGAIYANKALFKQADIEQLAAGVVTADAVNAVVANIQTAQIADAAITRAKIALAAIGAAQIEDAAITRAKIAIAAISEAQIEDAAISQAKIKNAAVDTLQLAGQSVTIPASAFSAGDVTKYTLSGWQTVLSLTVNHSGAPAYVHACFNAFYTVSSTPSSTTFTGKFRLLRGSTVLGEGTFGTVPHPDRENRFTFDDSASFGATSTPPAGNHTYHIQFDAKWGWGGVGVTISNRSLFVLETKR